MKLNNIITILIIFLASTFTAVGQSVGAWQVNCSQSRCEATPKSHPSDGFNLIVYNVQERPVIEVATPLGINLQKGINLLVDNDKFYTTTLLTCEVQGCRAYTELSSDILTALKLGQSVDVVVQTSKSREVLAFTYSLIGFTAAFDKVSAK